MRSVRWGRTGHGLESWPVAALLLVVVLLPTVGVLWFMGEAMRNERLAVRQKLSDVYRTQLVAVQGELQVSWETRMQTLDLPSNWDPQAPQPTPEQHFATVVREGWVGGLVILGEDGRRLYPASTVGSTSVTPDGRWRRAERIEHGGDPATAATRYAAIADFTDDPGLAARALQAQARCLVRAEQVEAALAVLLDTLGNPDYAAARDGQGRLIVPNAQLRALELLAEPSSPRFAEVAETLRRRLDDYGPPSLAASQRRFLMRQWLRWHTPDGESPPSSDDPAEEVASVFPTLAAEERVQAYLEADPEPPTSELRPSGVPGLWHVVTSGGRGVALFEASQLRAQVTDLLGQQLLPEEVSVDLLGPDERPEPNDLVLLPVGSFLPDWQLALEHTDEQLFATAADQQIQAYRLTAGLVVVTIVLLALLVARVLNRQLRLNRLKNDLLATVSHELKTPLASMRLLVDTLVDEGDGDPVLRRDYLQLMAQENLRLSRLVDNFLTFSRMEQGRYRFDRQTITPDEVVDTAVAAVAERFATAGCRFEVDVADDLPTLRADSEALVTVLINLLDNGFKYSGADKDLGLWVYAEDGAVCFAVRDNGVGMSSREASRIFDRFYQVDQSLARSASGCGLGLSIVRRIVEAHQGSVSVDSRPGAGSTFTVRIPAENDPPEGP